MTKTTYRWNKIIFWPAFVATLICLPGLVVQLLSHGHSPTIFNDWDEPLYLLILDKVGSYSLTEIFSNFPSVPSDFPFLPRFYSYSFVDYSLGNLKNSLNLTGPTFLLILDWVCVFLSFLAYRTLFSRFSNSLFLPECAAAAAIFYPYAFGQGLSLLPFKFLNLGLEIFPSIPSMRGIYTQISIPFFILTLNRFLDSVLSPSNSGLLKKCLVAGVLSGFLVFIYGFAWIAICCLSVAIVVTATFSKYLANPKIVQRTICFFLGATLLGLPGTLLTAGMRNAMGMYKGIGAPFNPWIPLDYLSCMGIIFFVVKKSREKQDKLWDVIFISCLLSEIGLRNLEYLTNQIWTSYHFSLFFLRPVIIGLIFIPFREWAESLSNSASNKSCFLILCAAATLIQSTNNYFNFSAGKAHSSIIDHLSTIKEDKIIGIPFIETDTPNVPSIELLPFWVTSLATIDAFYAETVFQKRFGLRQYGFVLLRTALITGGYPKSFCNGLRSLPPESTLDPLNRWAVVDFEKQCSELYEQILVLCQETNWGDWLPKHILINEYQYNLGMRYRTKATTLASFNTNPNLYLLSISASEEQNFICQQRNTPSGELLLPK